MKIQSLTLNTIYSKKVQNNRPKTSFGNLAHEVPSAVIKGIENNFWHPEILHLKEIDLLNRKTRLLEKTYFARVKYWNEPIKNALCIFDSQGEIISKIDNFIFDFQEGKLCLTAFSSPQKDKYKGAGSRLIQAAIEESINKGHGGELYVIAKNDFPGLKKYGSPIDFYLNQWFVFKDPYVSIKNLKENFKSLIRYGNSMTWEDYLLNHVKEEMILTPQTVQEKWVPTIRKNPIYDSTLAKLDGF